MVYIHSDAIIHTLVRVEVVVHHIIEETSTVIVLIPTVTVMMIEKEVMVAIAIIEIN